MALAIDIIDGRGLVTKHVMSYFKEELGNTLSKRHLTITNKMERFSFKSGRAVQVAKLIKEDRPIVLQ